MNADHGGILFLLFPADLHLGLHTEPGRWMFKPLAERLAVDDGSEAPGGRQNTGLLPQSAINKKTTTIKLKQKKASTCG